MATIDYCTITVPDNIQCRDEAIAFNTAMCKRDNAAATTAQIKYITCLSGGSGTNTLASFSQQYPDIAYDQTMLNSASNNYVNGNGELSSVIAFKTNLSNQIAELQSYQRNLIRSTPEYIDQTASPTFLSNINTVNIQASELQNKLSIVNANVQNLQSKAGGNMSAVTFYIYTTITVVIGILCILLIVYLVYMYMDLSSDVYSSSMRGGKRNPV
jgi:hypothetical protein